MYRLITAIFRGIYRGISGALAGIWNALIIVRKGMVDGWYKIDGPEEAHFEKRSTDSPDLYTFIPMAVGALLGAVIKWAVYPYLNAAKNVVFNVTELAMEDEPPHRVKSGTDFFYRLLASPFIVVGLVGFLIAGTLRTLAAIGANFSSAFEDWYSWKTPEPAVPLFSRKALARIPGALFGVVFALGMSVFAGVGLFFSTLIKAFSHGFDLELKYASSDHDNVYPILAFPIKVIANIFGFPVGIFARGLMEFALVIRFVMVYMANQLFATMRVLLESMVSGFELVFDRNWSKLSNPAHTPGQPLLPLFMLAKLLGSFFGAIAGFFALIVVNSIPFVMYLANLFYTFCAAAFRVLSLSIYSLVAGFVAGLRVGYYFDFQQATLPEDIKNSRFYRCLFYPLALFGSIAGVIIRVLNEVAVIIYRCLAAVMTRVARFCAWGFGHIFNAVSMFANATSQAAYHEFHAINNRFEDNPVSLEDRHYPKILGAPGAILGVAAACFYAATFHFFKNTMISLFSSLGSFFNAGMEREIFAGVDGPNRNNSQKAIGFLGYAVGYPLGFMVSGGLYIARHALLLATTIVYSTVNFIAIVIIKDFIWNGIAMRAWHACTGEPQTQQVMDMPLKERILLNAITVSGDLPDALSDNAATRQTVGWGSYFGKAIRGNQDSQTEFVIKRIFETAPYVINDDASFAGLVSALQDEEIHRQTADTCINLMSSTEEAMQRDRIRAVADQVRNYIREDKLAPIKEPQMPGFRHYLHPSH